jgi:hypothetical protein
MRRASEQELRARPRTKIAAVRTAWQPAYRFPECRRNTMRGYDWGFGFGFGQRHSARRRGYDAGFRRGYDHGFRHGGYDGAYWGEERGGRGSPGAWPRGWSGRQRGGYARGGEATDHPFFGGVPGGRERGMYFGGRGAEGARYGDDRGWEERGPRSGGRYGRYGYDAGFAEGPFVPERAYGRGSVQARDPRGGGFGPGGEAGVWTSPFLDDDEIAQAVRQSLYQDNWIDADEIEVEVDDGVVTLRGEVRDYIEARYAWDDTWETEGVRGVLNQLTVRTDQPSDDAGAEPARETEGGSEG